MPNSDVVRSFYRAFGAGDVPGAFAVLHADIEFHEQRSLPWGGVYKGHEGMQRFLGTLGPLFGAMRIDVHQVVDAPNGEVFVHAELKALDRVFPFLERWKIADGKAIRIEPFLDTLALVNRLKELNKL